MAEQQEMVLQNTEILSSLSVDYAQYLNFDTKPYRDGFDEKLEMLMTKMEEYSGLVDMIRGDTNHCLSEDLPKIYEKGKQLEEMFDRIDKLECFVKHVKDNLAEVEILIEQAESELAVKSPVVKFLTALPKPAFLQSKKEPARQPHKFEKPQIFNTDHFLISTAEEQQQTGEETAASTAAEETAASTAAEETTEPISRATETADRQSAGDILTCEKT